MDLDHDGAERRAAQGLPRRLQRGDVIGRPHDDEALRRRAEGAKPRPADAARLGFREILRDPERHPSAGGADGESEADACERLPVSGSLGEEFVRPAARQASAQRLVERRAAEAETGLRRLRRAGRARGGALREKALRKDAGLHGRTAVCS